MVLAHFRSLHLAGTAIVREIQAVDESLNAPNNLACEKSGRAGLQVACFNDLLNIS